MGEVGRNAPVGSPVIGVVHVQHRVFERAQAFVGELNHAGSELGILREALCEKLIDDILLKPVYVAPVFAWIFFRKVVEYFEQPSALRAVPKLKS